jgi:uncharacterized protein (DUF736 family)
MTFDPRNSGAIFANDKGDNPKRPDFTGNLDVDGRQFRVSAWWREARKDGSRFLSLKIEPPAAPREQPKPSKPDFDDSIPF